jgi:calcineurin-like phosphoesterase family protein
LLKIHNTKVWFTSDFHWNHDKPWIVESRGFKSNEDHCRWIFESWHDVIGTGDIVINLGDLTFGDPDGREFDSMSYWPCLKHMVLNGNHMSGQKQIYVQTLKRYNINEPYISFYPLKHNNIIFAGDYLELSIKKQYIVCFHYPLPIFNHMNRGGFMVSGHSHGNYIETNTENNTNKYIDVGVDSNKKRNGTPFISFEDLCEIMNNR